MIVQWDGRKAWWLGDDVLDTSKPPTLVMEPGDILIMPEGMLHDVQVANEPGYSRHLTMALITREPLAVG